MVKVKLLRPLDGKAAGETAEYPENDAARLESYGAVEIVGAKAAKAPANKMEAAVANKAAGKTSTKGKK